LLAAPIIVKYPLFKNGGEMFHYVGTKLGISYDFPSPVSIPVAVVVVLMLAATIWAIAQSNRKIKETQ